jgi:hypothetical protein
MHRVFDEYVNMAGFTKVDNAHAQTLLTQYKTIWNNIHAVAEANLPILKSLHFKVRTRFNYYMNIAFLEGTLKRATAMVEAERTIEAAHYLNSILLDIVENYAWLKSSVDHVKIDHTTLICSLEGLEQENPTKYAEITAFLRLDAIDKASAAEEIDRTRKAIFKIREDRKLLIKNQLRW